MKDNKIAYTTEKIISVDINDQMLGEIEKILAHEKGILHRAFSVLIFRYYHGNLQLLLQQRNRNKYHCGKLWTNTCCSHPHINEDLVASAKRCLLYEMGIETELKHVGKFHYTAKFDNGLTENEIDHVLVGVYDDDIIHFNKQEVEDYQWMDVSAVEKDLAANPTKYTPWFKAALDLALTEF